MPRSDSKYIADSLLAFAYETRDLHVAKLFYLERKVRQFHLAYHLQRAQLSQVRSYVSQLYVGLNDVKRVLIDKGYAKEVGKYTDREAPESASMTPSEFAFLYKLSGTVCLIVCRLINDDLLQIILISYHQRKPALNKNLCYRRSRVVVLDPIYVVDVLCRKCICIYTDKTCKRIYIPEGRKPTALPFDAGGQLESTRLLPKNITERHNCVKGTGKHHH